MKTICNSREMTYSTIIWSNLYQLPPGFPAAARP